MPAIALLGSSSGAGRTTLSFHLAGAFAKRGHRVLLVDCQGPANFSDLCFGIEWIRRKRTVGSLYGETPLPKPENLILATRIDNVSVLPNSDALDKTDAFWDNPHRERALKTYLHDVRDSYDVALLDCPRDFDMFCLPALVAADACLIPVWCDCKAVFKATYSTEHLERHCSKANPSVRLLGYAVNKHGRCECHKRYTSEMREAFGDAVLRSVIPTSELLQIATHLRVPVGIFRPRSVIARAIDAVAGEILSRMSIPSPVASQVA